MKALRRRAHPDFDDLVALATGLSASSEPVGRHAAQCPTCREQIARMSSQWRDLVRLTESAPGRLPSREALLEEILTLLEAWDGRRGGPAWRARRAAGHRAVARRLARELEIHLGALAEGLARAPAEHEAPVHALLARTGSLLSTFLGRRTAAALADEALSLTRRLPDR